MAVIPMQNYNKFTERQTKPSKYRIRHLKRGYKKAEARDAFASQASVG